MYYISITMVIVISYYYEIMCFVLFVSIANKSLSMNVTIKKVRFYFPIKQICTTLKIVLTGDRNQVQGIYAYHCQSTGGAAPTVGTQCCINVELASQTLSQG